MSEQEFMRPMDTVNNDEVLRLQKKQLGHARIQTILMSGMLIIVLLVGMLVTSLSVGASRGLQDLERSLRTFDVDALNDAVSELTESASLLNKIDMSEVNSAISSLKDAAALLSGMDATSLNHAVDALGEAALTFSGIDTESLNSLVSSLQTVAGALEGTVNMFSGLFGRN